MLAYPKEWTVGASAGLPGLSLLGTAYNLEHPFLIRGSSRLSNGLSAAEGTINLMAAGLMYKGITEGELMTALTGFTLGKVGFVITGLHTLGTQILSHRFSSEDLPGPRLSS